MYSLEESIKIRRCQELSFFVNIRTNRVYSVNTLALDFFLDKLKDGLTDQKARNVGEQFYNFILHLKRDNIIAEKK